MIDTNRILEDIYKKIFLREQDYTINIFLCGAKNMEKDTVRFLIYEEIKDNSKYNVIFPEWLFSNLLVKKEYNLLKLEHELASQVDAIVLPLEGYGAIAEIGAFSSINELVGKIIVINKKKYKRESSFINLGPIKLILNENKENVIYIDNNHINKLDNEKENAKIKKMILQRIKSLRKVESKHEIKNLFNLSRFILNVIAIFQPILKKEIVNLLKKFRKNIPPYYVEPCLEILLEKGKVDRDVKCFKDNYEECYTLTKSGHNYIYEDLLNKLKIVKPFSIIRSQVLSYKNSNKKNIDLDEEFKSFLET